MTETLQKFLDGKKYRFAILAFLLGSMSALSMAPTFHVWALLIGLSGLYILLALSPTQFCASLSGYSFGLGYFGFGLSWIGNALLVEGNAYAWAWPLAIAGFPIILSLFTAFGSLCTKRFCNLKKITGFAGFIFFMSISEWLRGNILTGFPWNLFGYSWAEHLEIVQIISLGDIYLLNILTIFWLSSLGFLMVSESKIPLKAITAILVLASFAGNYTYGAQRLSQNPTQYDETIKLILIQPNIKQSEKWKEDKIIPNFEKLLSLIQEALNAETGEANIYVALPETSFPPFITENQQAKDMLAQSLSVYKGNVFVIAGVLRHDKELSHYYNSVVMFDKNAKIINIYDKHHLVPFGEYIPFNEIIDIAPIVGFSGFQAGSGPAIEKTHQSLHYYPVICYEVIFPHIFSRLKGNQGTIIINVTNDAWYGDSAGPYQHFTQTKFRAIESNTPLIRVANTGISSVIDPYGREIQKSHLFQTVTISNFLPITNK